MPPIIMIILSVILIGCFIGALLFYFKARTITLIGKEKQENLDKEIHRATNFKNEIEETIKQLRAEYENLANEKTYKQINLSKELDDYKAYINLQKENIEKDFNTYKQTLQEDHDAIKESLDEDIATAQGELDNLRESLRAGAEASARARAEREKKEFYKLHVDADDLDDILLLENLKYKFSNPTVLSKLIWSQYFLSETNAMCRRVVGEGKVSGIYKITNVNTEQCYIGQSVDITERWKSHIKCGLGIEASSTNALYKAMQQIGVWNFTFEVLEECSKDQLDAKEKQWIDFFNSAELGYNKTKGNG